MEDHQEESTSVDVPITRLPLVDGGAVREHLVRWHAFTIEDVGDASEGDLLRTHEAIHKYLVGQGRTLGHAHDLTAAEVKMLEQGAQAALRRSR